jgi:esterase/lipase superfamily enzyme
MDRQFLARSLDVALFLPLLLAGCAKSSPDKGAQQQASATAPDESIDTAGDGVARTHRPVIVGPEHEHSQMQPGAAAPADDSASASSAPVEPPAFYPAEATPESAAPAAGAVNPLRSAMLPPQPEPNPLRSPRSFSPAQPSRSFAPAVESQADPPQAFPEAAPEAAPPTAFPEFAPESASPPAGDAPSAAAPDEPGAAAPTPEPAAIEPAIRVRAQGADSSSGGAAEPSASALPLAAAPPTGPYDVVQVFYGTDRAEVAPLGVGLAAGALRFLPTGCAILVTLCLGLIAVAKKKSGMLWALVFLGAVVTGGLALQASSTTFTAIRWENKAGLRYGVERSSGGEVSLGICEVTIPKIHKTGELESPSILRLEVKDDLAKHVALLKTDRLQSNEFYAQLKARVAASPRNELFVFVHGFNVTFEDAARRTAQIHKDLNFPGAPVFFSWPANDKFLLTYPADENAVTWATPHLKQFLLDVVKHSDAQSVNLIAHSMGNRALTVALREIELEFQGQARLFNNVVLAAPDIDANDFKTNIAPRLQNTAKHFTLYASSRDDALRASQLLHRGARAGDAGRGLVVVSGIDTIDVSAIDTSPWGHSYYGSSDPVLQDLGILMAFGFPPQDRDWLSPAERDGLTYWIFEPTQTASLPIPPPR